jgi:hypothetical protein
MDSIVFIRKNIYVLLPDLFLAGLNLLLKFWVPESMVRALAFVLIACFFQMFVVVIVYRAEKIISGETIWRTFNRFSGSVLLLTIYYVFYLVVLNVVLRLVFQNIRVLANFFGFLVFCIALIAYPLSMRHLIYYNNIMIVDSIKAGVKELYTNFFYYFFVVLLGAILLVFPSLIFPSSWLTLPFLPIAEAANVGIKNGMNWFGFLLQPILSTLVVVALTYAFIFKNKKEKHVS